jgi:hypothetical protein
MAKSMTVKDIVKGFIGLAPCGHYLTKAKSNNEAGSYRWSEWPDDCGPMMDREIVALKRMDGTIKFFGRFADGNTNNN